jgi:hypothetical protein
MRQLIISLFAVFVTVNLPTTNVGDIAISPISEETTGENFVFNANYPRFSGIGEVEAQKNLNAEVYELVQQSMYRTKAAAVRLPTDDRSRQSKAEGRFEYQVMRNSGGIVSLLFTDTLSKSDTDKSQTKMGFSFYTGNGKTLSICDLFLNSEEGISKVNDEISRQINQRGLVKSLQKSNLKIEKDNCNFYLNNSELVVIIPEMTWFARNMGIVEFTIPFNQLKGCLKTNIIVL